MPPSALQQIGKYEDSTNLSRKGKGFSDSIYRFLQTLHVLANASPRAQ